jgi:hypothetical protein
VPVLGPGSQPPLLVPTPQQHNPVLLQNETSRLPSDDESFLLMQSSAASTSASKIISLTPSRKMDCSGNCADTQRNHTIPIDNDGSGSVSAIVGAPTDEQQNQGFYGTSSAVTFMQQIRQAIDARIGVSPESGNEWHRNNHQPFTYADHENRSTTKRTVHDYVLPPRRLADNLVQTYWLYVYPLYPFLDKRDFMQIYNTIWAGDWKNKSSSSSYASSLNVDEPTAVCILNMVLALGCQYSDAADGRSHRDMSKDFFFRAKECLQFDPLDSSNYSRYLVQALLLSGQYLQSIGSPHEAWGAIGVATRMCHELGYHLALSTASERAIQSGRTRERETTRRVYHGCVMMDRYVC